MNKTNEQLIQEYIGLVGEIRYYHATDDSHSWNKEKVARESTEQKFKELKAEFVKRDLAQPHVP